MKRTMIRYKLKPDCVAENDELLRGTYEELERTQPDGLRFATFRLDDGLSLVHLVSVETADGRSPLANSVAFGRYSEHVRERCEAPPEFSNLDEIGAFRVFGR